MSRIMIIGGGIGGLCLAHGLHGAGIEVEVFERTTAYTDWLQGYRIHINPHGSAALHACLPPANWHAFLDTVSTSRGGFGFATEQLDDLLRFSGAEIRAAVASPTGHYGVSRTGLRAVLLAGLEDVVHHGRTFEDYEMRPDGRVTARFADGSTATADLLVGADGANSRVRGQVLPAAARLDTGVTAIAGKHPLTEAARAVLPEVLTADANIIIPSGQGLLFTAVWQRDRQTLRDEDDADYTFWAYADASTTFPGNLEDRSGTELTALVADRTRTWAPAIRDLVIGSDPGTVNAIRVRTASPVTPWPTGPVTLLGDAIHHMTPMAGIGANTALRDADLLRRQLLAARDRPLGPAVREYERQMLDYGFAAVRRSLRNARQAGSGSRLGRTAFRTALRTINAVPPLRRRMASNMGS